MGPELAVIQRQSGDKRRLSVAFGDNQPVLGAAGEQVAGERVLERLELPRLVGVKDELTRPLAEMRHGEGFSHRDIPPK